MNTKEEYVEWVKQWKITHEALVKLQLHVKKYLIKTTYPQKKFRLSDEEIRKFVGRFEKVYGGEHWWITTDRLNYWNHGETGIWNVEYMKSSLRHRLCKLHKDRASMKEHFKTTIETAAGV